MDFISNLMKRPISLVMNETAAGMDTDKTQISSKPLNNLSISDNKNETTVNDEDPQKEQIKDENSSKGVVVEQSKDNNDNKENTLKTCDKINECENNINQEHLESHNFNKSSLHNSNNTSSLNDQSNENLNNLTEEVKGQEKEQISQTNQLTNENSVNNLKIEVLKSEQIDKITTGCSGVHQEAQGLLTESPQQCEVVEAEEINIYTSGGICDENKPLANDQSSSNRNDKYRNARLLNLSSSFNGNLTDFIGVPEDYIGRFEDVLLPPPPSALMLSTDETLISTMENEDNLSPYTPLSSPPPSAAAMSTSQTIDELLSEISDNFTLAGINDDVLSIASPPSSDELSPMSSKSGLNNSKLMTPSSSPFSLSSSSTQMHTPRTPTTASSCNDLAANPIVAPIPFETNLTSHNLPVNPDVETGDLDGDRHQYQNTSGVNKSSNKFVGLTEFDEAKIPDLPGDLNPNIEEQYRVTFEECFIPTFEAKQGTKSESSTNKTHYLLPNETNTTIAAANETFSDCLDDRDPLSGTYLEQPNFCDTISTDCDGYESAVNDITYDEGVADATIEIGSNTIQVVDNKIESLPQHKTCMEFGDEPMDVDMNATMEIIQKSTENIENIEKVLQHVENVLQHLDDEKENFDVDNRKQNICEAKVIGSLSKQPESSKMTFIVNQESFVAPAAHSPHLEMEQSNHDVSLNKSIELPVKNVIPHSSECVIAAAGNNENSYVELKNPTIPEETLALSKVSNTENPTVPKESLESAKESSNDIGNISPSAESLNTIGTINTSICKSPLFKMNSTLNMNTSTGSLKSAGPSSPLFPIKQQQTGKSFPKSPKSKLENSNKPPFLEKSDYVEKLEQKLNTQQKGVENKSVERLENLSFSNATSTVQTDSRRHTFTANPQEENQKRKEESTNMGMGFPAKTQSNNSRRTFCINQVSDESIDQNKTVDLHDKSNSRRTFDIPTDLIQSTVQNETADSQEKINSRRTFDIATDEFQSTAQNETADLHDKSNSRRTFDIATDEIQSTAQNETADLHDKSNSRRTFDISTDEIQSKAQSETVASQENNNSKRNFNTLTDDIQSKGMNTSIEPMEIDENVNTTISSLLEAAINQSKSESLSAAENKIQLAAFSSQHLFDLSALVNVGDNSSDIPSTHNPSHTSTLSLAKNLANVNLPNMLNMPDSSIPQNKADSPPLPISSQNMSNSSTLCTLERGSVSPPLPTEQRITNLFSNHNLVTAMHEETMSTNQKPHEPLSTSIKKEQASFSESLSGSSYLNKIQKRPSIHGLDVGEKLSAKEQNNTKIKDEKDEVVEKSTPSPLEEMFTAVTATSTSLTNPSDFSSFERNSLPSATLNSCEEDGTTDEDFQGNNNLILNPSDFDYLLTKGNNNTPVDRNSLLLKFDPLLGVPVPSNQGQQQPKQPLNLQIPTNLNNNPYLSPTIEEDEHNDSTNRSFVAEKTKSSSLLCGLGRGAAGSASSIESASSSSAKLHKDRSHELKQQHQSSQTKRQLPQLVKKKNATMSVDVIKDMSLDNNDCNKAFENSNSTQSDDKQNNYKMDDLEKKIKNEVLKTEDIEKKLKDAEQREEALIKRITEKDKTVAKMTGVIEAYEKAIAELIAEKEQLIQNYEKQLAEVKADRDSNYHHLTSLETTFSDLHVKYEKSKEMTCHLKGNEESLISENRKNSDNLRLQEQRYDKMRNHAMQQLEIANKKLECLTREHTMEITKLKALLKKEEIARSSMSEQLAQKTKENTELVKICDELIQGQGS